MGSGAEEVDVAVDGVIKVVVAVVVVAVVSIVGEVVRGEVVELGWETKAKRVEVDAGGGGGEVVVPMAAWVLQRWSQEEGPRSLAGWPLERSRGRRTRWRCRRSPGADAHPRGWMGRWTCAWMR